jgi:hypothetical protein
MLYFSEQAAKSRESACQWYSRLLLLAACSLFFNASGLCALVTVRKGRHITMYERSRNLIDCHIAGFTYYDGLEVIDQRPKTADANSGNDYEKTDVEEFAAFLNRLTQKAAEEGES